MSSALHSHIRQPNQALMSHLSLIHCPSSNQAGNVSVKFIYSTGYASPETKRQCGHVGLRFDQWTENA